MKCLRCGSTKHLVRGCPQPDLRPAADRGAPSSSVTPGSFFSQSYMVSFDDDENNPMNRSDDLILTEVPRGDP
eukprot:9394720-Heterocapsa_arctica.AAC.1